jgi:CO/xanthine dehydrogenase Mo-binding subunit
MLVEGQVEGGISMGVGFALEEEISSLPMAARSTQT